MPETLGFLPTRGSFVLDAIFLAMFVIMAALTCNILLAKRGRYQVHRKSQIALSVVLLVAILIFEFDVRFVTDWRKLAEASIYYASGWVDRMLWIHLAFAIPTPFVWGWVIYRAMYGFRVPLGPAEHSRFHKRWGWVATLLMFGTGITGCLFYWCAFVA